jgi:hypothetical protein
MQLLVEKKEDVALDGVGRDEVIDLRGVALAVAMDAPDAMNGSRTFMPRKFPAFSLDS